MHLGHEARHKAGRARCLRGAELGTGGAWSLSLWPRHRTDGKRALVAELLIIVASSPVHQNGGEQPLQDQIISFSFSASCVDPALVGASSNPIPLPRARGGIAPGKR